MTNPTTSELLDRLTNQTGVDVDVIEAVAASCGRHLAKLDGEDASRDLLESEPLNATDIALAMHRGAMRDMRLKIHNRPDDFARLALDVLTSEVTA